MGILCLEVKLLAMWERSKRERVSAFYILTAWNNHILSLCSRLIMSINLGDACDLPCFKLCGQEHLLEFIQPLSVHLSSQNHHLSFFFFARYKAERWWFRSDIDTHLCCRAPNTSKAAILVWVWQPGKLWNVTQAACVQLQCRFLSQMNPDQDGKLHP